jgi:hypothetical protein
MTYPPPPGPDGIYPPPSDPPIQAYQPPGPQQHGYPAPPPYDYGTPGSAYYQPAYPYAPARPTEGLAIASLVVACVGVLGLCFWTVGGVLGIVAAILGHVARRRIRVSGAGGEGMALAGIIVGWVTTGVAVLGAAALIAFVFMDRATY